MTRHEKPTWVRALLWPVSWLLDRNLDLSTSKIMAFAILVSNDMGKAVPTLLAGTLIAASFGYSAWKDWVARGSWSQTSAATEAFTHTNIESHTTVDTHNTTENIQRAITERRDLDKGFEATP